MARTPARLTARAHSAAIERETQLIREAIAMVAFGASPRVVVAGIHYGENLLGTARLMGLEAGVRVNPLWRGDHAGSDIVVEPIHK